MDLFVIGDVHGCFHTFENIVEKHWNKQNEILIQIGDLVDRGKNSPQTVQYARKLKEEHPNGAFFLKGNHEFEMILHDSQGPNEHWLRQCGNETLEQYKRENRDVRIDVNWFSNLPLFWENEEVYISHAGISQRATNPFDENDEMGILWNRSALKNIGKLQIIGHTPCTDPTYDEVSNSWNIDTGAAFYGYLTGVKLSGNGEVITFVKEETDPRD